MTTEAGEISLGGGENQHIQDKHTLHTKKHTETKTQWMMLDSWQRLTIMTRKFFFLNLAQMQI